MKPKHPKTKPQSRTQLPLRAARIWFLIPFLLASALPALAQCYLRPTNIMAWWPGDGHTSDVIDSSPGVLQNGAAYGAAWVA